MKKAITFLICLLLTFSLLSCGKQEAPATDVPDVTEIGTLSADASTYPKATVPVYTEESTAQETEPDIQTEESTVQEMVYPPYEDKFTSFMQIGDYDIFTNKSAVIVPTRWNSPPRLAFFKVVGMEEEYETDFIFYKIQFEEIYGMENYDKEKIYTMAWLGHLEEQLYGRPPLEMGKVYARVWLPDEESMKTGDRFPAGLIYKVVEEDGKRYLYGYGADLSQMECSIKITDPVENCPYEKGKHDKAIAYLQSIGKPLPTFDYKCEARAFYEECGGRLPS